MLDLADSTARPPDAFTGREIKQTRSLCPQCLEMIDAKVFEREGKVWMDKTCPDHGSFTALLADDVRHYYVADPRVEALGSCCGPSGCAPPAPRYGGDQVVNHSCNMLIEVTQRCNLRCPTCYADSSPEREETLSVEDYSAMLDDLLGKGKGDADLIQLSGGEPTIHPQIFELVDIALERGFKQVYINTNGIKLARRDFAEKLAARGDRVSVYLQFDGFERRALKVLRGREDLLETKLAALQNCEELGIATVPVMTLTPEVNDDQLGRFIGLGISHPRSVRKIMIQPAMYSGRNASPRVVERMTVAEVARRIVEQTDGVFTEDDFGPIPCSDPNCFSVALALRTDGGMVPVSRYFPRYDTWADSGTADLIASVTDTFDSATDLREAAQWAFSSGALDALDDDTVDTLLDRIAQWQADTAETADAWGGLFAIGIKPFMDAYTYDQDRIDKCCVHIIATDGTPVSFCEYNARNRPKGQL